MATTQQQLLPSTTHAGRLLATIAIVCALLLAVAAMATSLLALNDDPASPAPRSSASAAAQVPVCPMRGFC